MNRICDRLGMTVVQSGSKVSIISKLMLCFEQLLIQILKHL